jgi:hypothetical protein
MFLNVLESIRSFQKSALEQGICDKAALGDFYSFSREKYL